MSSALKCSKHIYPLYLLLNLFFVYNTCLLFVYHFVNSVGADEVRHAFNGYSVPTLIDQNVNFLIIKATSMLLFSD